ncbi:tRNA-guanine transglycosylase family protein [Rhizodiscina lignyota]|uniref:Queuine tRNA-ribosyltransferase accessory subunit 2 n=1 Tax=Rhizodiscina lignyota TaxID=1504668 RepID=A0A9P4ICX6_9PEZI|nr:tRNA-guanine transglycosylase family protein [Rhizodiscina lignyota]
MLAFTILKAATAAAPRLGRLALPGKKIIDTPCFIGNTSRGVVPHLSPDNLHAKTSLGGVYLALEDFIEKSPEAVPPIFQTPSLNNASPLTSYCGLPHDILTILGARRTPPVPCAKANTNTAVSILTSVGFRQVDATDYAAAVQRLKPDIAVGLADIMYDKGQISSKRIDKMGDRTGAWTRTLIQYCQDDDGEKGSLPHIFAPILPIESQLQSYYINQLLDDDLKHQVSGFTVYDAESLLHIPQELSALPRLALSEPNGPTKLLLEISLGVDIFTVPFIGTATDAGIALDFEFPPPSQVNGNSPKPLGTDGWLDEHAADTSPLAPSCECYSCRNHHRAFLHHLLSAREMLAWVLLQIHNHRILDQFFAGVRKSIAKDTFEEDKAAFEKYYEPELRDTTGQGPRVRGYQFKSEGRGEPKKNPKAYGRLDDAREKFAEGVLPSPNADAEDLERAGMGSVVL